MKSQIVCRGAKILFFAFCQGVKKGYSKKMCIFVFVFFILEKEKRKDENNGKGQFQKKAKKISVSWVVGNKTLLC